MLEAIQHQTGLQIALDGVYRWVAFLPSKRDPRAPVANRYFGVFQDGEIKDPRDCRTYAQYAAVHFRHTIGFARYSGTVGWWFGIAEP